MKTISLCLRLLLCCLAGWALNVGAAISVLEGSPENQTGTGKLGLKPNASTGDGDLLIAQIVAKSEAKISAPSGWMAIGGASTNQGGIQQQIYYLVASGGDASRTHQFSITQTAYSSNGVILSIRGWKTTAPICGTGLQAGGGNQAVAPNVQTQPPTCPAGSLRLAFFAINDASVNVTLNLSTSDSATGAATAGPSDRAGGGHPVWVCTRIITC